MFQKLPLHLLRGVGVLGWRQRPLKTGHSPQDSQAEAIEGRKRNYGDTQEALWEEGSGGCGLPVWGPSEHMKWGR